MQKSKVCLVQMPYSPIEQPSVGLSILKAALNTANISATVFYANCLWAQKIGLHVYYHVSRLERYDLAAEWTFSEAAFPDFKSDHKKYFHHIQSSLRPLELFLNGRFDDQKCVQAQDLLWKLRQLAPAFVSHAAQTILELQPCIVGCSSTFQQHCASLALLKQIKTLNPNIVTMMGGANCEESMGVVTHKKCPWIDFVVSGEADLLFPQMCQRVLTAGSHLSLHELPEGVLGPAHRCYNNNGRVIGYEPRVEKFPPRAKIKDMKDSPTPDYDDYFTALQTFAIGKLIRPGLPVETSRGCWWGEKSHCTFCGLNHDNMNYRSKEPSRVIKEFEYLSQRYGIKNFTVIDNILDFRYFKTVIPMLAAQKQNYSIYYETKANLTRENLQTMAEAGIRWITPGIESFDNTLLQKLGKGTTVHQNIQLMKWAREMGIFNFWVMLYDIPGETDDIYLKFVEWLPKISHLQPPFRLAFFGYYRFSPSQQQPALFNLNLSPHHSYSYVYPWSEQVLKDFAYYFNDYTKGREQIDLHKEGGLQRPGLRALRSSILCWQQEWMIEGEVYRPTEEREPAILVMTDDGEQIEITDTRQCALQPKFYLKGLSRQIYHICDKARKDNGILTELQSKYHKNYTWEVIEPSVHELCEKGLLLELDGYFLSLAVRGSLKPLPKPW
jgi:magnesium-protoporphyrin IX monomethyl ester (oxidative) cyclase